MAETGNFVLTKMKNARKNELHSCFQILWNLFLQDVPSLTKVSRP